jgi:HD-GYP domain-containing protein (c-di-GMP phosphodiesterase class II)
MTRPAISSYEPAETIRDRCRALGLPTWRADTAGVITEEPADAGVFGLWLRSGRMATTIQATAKAWASAPKPSIHQPMPGCWLLPIPEEQRRRRLGITIAVAIGPELLTADAFVESCRAARLEVEATRAALRRSAIFDESSATRTAATLQWMVRDLAQLNEYQDAVHGFTNELTDSYETIDLLYGLGRSMLDLDRPEKFVSLLCDRLYETMPFGWVAARFEPTELSVGALAARVVTRGEPPHPEGGLSKAIESLKSRVGAENRGFIISGTPEFGPHTDGRILAQPVTRAGNLAGFLLVGEKHGEDPQISSYDIQLLEAAAAFSGAFLENAQLYRDHQAMFMGTLKALTSAIDAKDRYTCGHSERVAMLAARLAEVAGLTAPEVERIHITGLLHDVGKIGVPEAVLCKPGRLTEQEFALIKLHPEIGHRILKDIPQLADILPGVLHHHERWDGKGYPHGLKADQIPLPARILALADTFDAMSSNRSYRAAMQRDVVLAEIERSAGTQFDAQLAAMFIKLDLAEYDAMVARHAQEAAAVTPPPLAVAA